MFVEPGTLLCIYNYRHTYETEREREGARETEREREGRSQREGEEGRRTERTGLSKNSQRELPQLKWQMPGACYQELLGVTCKQKGPEHAGQKPEPQGRNDPKGS